MIRSHYHVRQCVLQGRSSLISSNLHVSKFGATSSISQRYSSALSALTTDKKEIAERVIRREDAQLRGKRLPSPGEVLAKKSKWVVPAPGSKRFLEANGLEDPLKLAEYVLAQLRKGRVDDAEMVVKNASSLGQYTVSWNHLIKWYASEGKLKMALGLYNDMKKRGQHPDAHTYTIILSNIADHNYPSSAAKALSIFNSMDLGSSPIQPNIIHTNAVLDVCARAGDMDAMFGVAAKLKSKGPGSANSFTYTTILNGIRNNVPRPYTKPRVKVSEGEIESLYSKAVSNARTIWQDIVNRWRHGDMTIDEELVCSMGRILLLGSKADKADVFKLLEQTMQIPKPARLPHHSSQQPLPKPAESGDSTGTTDIAVAPKPPFDIFKPVQPTKPVSRSRKATSDEPSQKGSRRNMSLFAQPGRNSLSLVLEACQDLMAKDPLEHYWNYFTEESRIIPDKENYHDYLRVLRQLRSSTTAAQVVESMPSYMPDYTTFRVTMSACARDKNNPHAFTNANRIYKVMEDCMNSRQLLHYHPKILKDYLEVAYTAPVYSTIPAADGERAVSKERQGLHVLAAFNRLEAAEKDVLAELKFNENPKPRYRGNNGPNSPNQEWVKSAIHFLQAMVGTCDRLMNHGMVERSLYKELAAKRGILAQFVTRYNERLLGEIRKKTSSGTESLKSEEGSLISAEGEAPKAVSKEEKTERVTSGW